MMSRAAIFVVAIVLLGISPTETAQLHAAPRQTLTILVLEGLEQTAESIRLAIIARAKQEGLDLTVETVPFKELGRDETNFLLRGAILVAPQHITHRAKALLTPYVSAALQVFGVGVAPGETSILHFVTYRMYGWPDVLKPNDSRQLQRPLAIGVGVLGAGGQDLLRAIVGLNATCGVGLLKSCRAEDPGLMPGLLKGGSVKAFVVESLLCPRPVWEAALLEAGQLKLVGLKDPDVAMLMTERSGGPAGPRAYLPKKVDPGACLRPPASDQTGRTHIMTVSDPAFQTSIIGGLGDPRLTAIVAEAVAQASISLLKAASLATHTRAVRLLMEKMNKEIPFHPVSWQVFVREFRQ